MTNVNTRELILYILLEVNKNGEYSHIAIRNVMDKYQFLDKKDRSFIKIVSEGTIERKLSIDFMISQYSSVKINKMKPVIREILRMSVYQMKYMDQVPVSAICNEAVKLASSKGFKNLKGFVNGVLRNMARDEKEVFFPDLSTRYSMPQWIVTLLVDTYGEEITENILKSSLVQKKTTIRCNMQKQSVEELTEMLMKEGVTLQKAPLVENALTLLEYDSIARLDSFKKGCFSVQDLSSMLVGMIANPKEGNHVIDVCAAPGGKSLHIAELLKNTGLVLARDLTEYKVSMIREGIERMGFANIQAQIVDALVLNEEDIESADLVIADLPCSGLGVMGRKNDLKYRMTEESMVELVELQRNILKIVSNYVKPGGILIYSTCTINPNENVGNVSFITEQLPFLPVSFEEELPEELRGGTATKGYLQLLQGNHPCDGFFISKFEKKESVRRYTNA